ncbi:baeRF2 domain-containing protein [Streptomyces sp. NPDC002405]|uniref:baeRF2 domain-containing protein n=1 Tax=unclassified Streptomyces TaxID=2593676 RepID=UPI0036C04D6B
MRLSFLEPLYKQSGPFASVYMDTSRDSAVADPDTAIALRWRHLRDTLLSEGADRSTITAVADLVGSDTEVPGPHGQAVFTAHGHAALLDELPLPPTRDTAHFGTLPDTMPLIVQHAPGIPYLAVHVRYGGRHSTDATGTVRVDAEAGTWPLTKVAPGHRLHEEIPVGDWPRAAQMIGRELEGHARRTDCEAVVVAGDVWARGILVNRLPPSLRGHVTTVEGTGESVPGRALLEQRLDSLFSGRMAAHDRGLLDVFLAQRAHGGATAEGISATVSALQRGRVKALFLNNHPESPLRLWVGPEPGQLALTEEELRSYGVQDVRAERADAALTRALVGTRAELVLVPERELRLHEGVGVLLRYPLPRNGPAGPGARRP